MKGKITNSLKPPLTKRPFALGYWELWDKENLQATLNVYSKCLWMHTRERVGHKIGHKVHRYQMDGPLWKWNQNKWLHWLLLKSPFSEKHISFVRKTHFYKGIFCLEKYFLVNCLYFHSFLVYTQITLSITWKFRSAIGVIGAQGYNFW